MHNKVLNNQHNQPLFEGLEYKDLEGLLKPTIHVDEFAAKMGDDDDIIVLSFFVRDKAAAKDLMNWFEKGYDFVLDADKSPGEIKPGRYLVYLEMRRRSTAPQYVQRLLDDLTTLTEYEPDDWIMRYDGAEQPWSEEAFAATVPMTPDAYRAKTDESLNGLREAAGIAPRQIYSRRDDIKAIQAAAGIL